MKNPPREVGVYSYYEFFAGGGMARAGLGENWSCLFANDFDRMKADVYCANWQHELTVADIATIKPGDLPGQVDLAWASFPCQDLSLAGDYRGLGAREAISHTRSGTFWPFWHLICSLQNRLPKLIVLENVYGVITSNRGKDFEAIAAALYRAGYCFGALVVDAKYFVPQSRPRFFMIAVRSDLNIPRELMARTLSEKWHHQALREAVDRLDFDIKSKWIWWKLPAPRKRSKTFADIIENKPTGVAWDTPEETKRLLAMMTPINLKKVREAKGRDVRIVGGVYKRTRTQNGRKAQRAEVRFDDIAGCLRTPAGGSSRQRILVVERQKVRSRLLSPREAARLMGLPDTYKLPVRYNDAYHVAGDGVVVQVVKHIAENLLEPVVEAQRMLQAAE